MGMYDYIRCRVPLPSDPKPPNVEWFQTKDVPTVQLYLEQWTIDAGGRLIKHGVRYEDRSDKKAKGIKRLIGMRTSVPVPEDDQAVPFHGDIGFYHYNSQIGEYWDYVARFTEGLCTRIWCQEYTAPELEKEGVEREGL